jgi:hypothetical protein
MMMPIENIAVNKFSTFCFLQLKNIFQFSKTGKTREVITTGCQNHTQGASMPRMM